MARPPKTSDTALLDRAADLVWRAGADAVSIRDLETDLDLKAPSIYRRFHSRTELISRAIDRYTDTVVAGRIARYVDDADDPVAGLHGFLSTARKPMPGEVHPRGCLLTVTAAQEIHGDPMVRASVDRGLRIIANGLRRTTLRLSDSGRLRADMDHETAAELLFVGFEGLVTLARVRTEGLEPMVDAIMHAVVAPCAATTSESLPKGELAPPPQP